MLTKIGFSALQQNKLSDVSKINASHVSTFCMAVDRYRPLYSFLENVVPMASAIKGVEDQNVLSQLVGCLLGMAYQVRSYLTDL